MLQKIHEAGLNWQVDSAGTNGYHTGEAPHPHSQQICSEHGINISLQRSRKFVREDLHRYDKIFVMAGDVLAALKEIAGKDYTETKVDFLMEPLYPNQQKDIPDPWYGNASGYRPVYQMIEEACTAWLKQLQEQQ